MKLPTLILTSKDIRRILSIKDTLRIVEDAFRAHGNKKTQMPAKIYIKLHQYNGDLRVMPAFIETTKACGMKWVSVYPDNKMKGLPTTMAVIILNDAVTGFPLAIMDGTYITKMRTGAAGGIAAKYLARKDSKIAAMVGCGSQAESQLAALSECFSLELVKVCGQSSRYAEDFIKRMKGLKLKMAVSETVRDCVQDADILVTTTPSRKPIVRLEWLKRGTHINAIGADARGKQELEPDILKNAKVVIDDWSQAPSSGEINVPWSKGLIKRRDICSTLGEVINRRIKIRTKADEITVFDSTGLAIQDISCAQFAYSRAKKQNIGKEVKII
ncbi:MAG: alanine dehydrogenase [Omnitrophica WOR_2 bacterium RIFCSPHIGHO2_02_FULL_45_21]|nr:MAG: alanine dehydrogenase [Omnitrophica WOR_2 bacterium RIFCSPHIGHO2_02_FULL_45_21]